MHVWNAIQYIYILRAKEYTQKMDQVSRLLHSPLELGQHFIRCQRRGRHFCGAALNDAQMKTVECVGMSEYVRAQSCCIETESNDTHIGVSLAAQLKAREAS